MFYSSSNHLIFVCLIIGLVEFTGFAEFVGFVEFIGFNIFRFFGDSELFKLTAK